MEPTEDFCLTSTPRILIVACIILLLLRIALAIFEWNNPPERGRSGALDRCRGLYFKRWRAKEASAL